MTTRITTQDIALEHLELHPSNVRKTRSGELYEVGIEALMHNIEEVGLINLLCVQQLSNGRYGVFAGGRRLEALVRSSQFDNGRTVPCHVYGEGDVETISLAENELHSGMGPLDRFEAYNSLAQKDHTTARCGF